MSRRLSSVNGGNGTRILTPEAMQAEWPWMEVEGLLCGSHNPMDEGYFDGSTVFDWFRRKARARGVEYVHDEDDRVDYRTFEDTGTVEKGQLLLVIEPEHRAGHRQAANSGREACFWQKSRNARISRHSRFSTTT